MSSKLRFLAIATATIGGSAALFLWGRRRSELGNSRMARYPRPSYAKEKIALGVGPLPARHRSKKKTTCEPAVKDSAVTVCVTKPTDMGPSITRPDDVCRILKKTGDADRESFYTVMLNVKNQVIGIQEANRGNLTDVSVHPRELFRPAIMAGAVSMVVAHNHPSGDPTPSTDDFDLTRRLLKVGEMVGIPVLDHVIVGNDRCYYMSEQAPDVFR